MRNGQSRFSYTPAAHPPFARFDPASPASQDSRFPPAPFFGPGAACYFPSTASLHKPQAFESSATMVSRAPRVSPEAKVVEFLTFHRHFVIPNHYFRYHDFNEFCNTGLIHLANTFEPARYAVAAYAALLYSAFRRDQRAREYAFLYYAQSIYCVQGMMNEPGTMPALPTLVAILELGSFEVCYRNLAALI